MRIYLFRWWRYWQVDARFGDSPWLSVGLKWTSGFPRPVFYISPDATPQSKTFGWTG